MGPAPSPVHVSAAFSCPCDVHGLIVHRAATRASRHREPRFRTFLPVRKEIALFVADLPARQGGCRIPKACVHSSFERCAHASLFADSRITGNSRGHYERHIPVTCFHTSPAFTLKRSRMTESKPTTNDILAKIRAQKAGAKEDTAPAESSSTPESASPTESAPAEPAKPATAPPTGNPADILAAVRKQGAVGGKKAAATPAAAPRGTSDILSAIRGGGGGGGAAASPAKKTPAAAKPTAVDTAAASGMSAAEMVKAARSGPKTTADEKPEIRLPVKPLAAKVPKPVVSPTKKTVEPRRSFLGRSLAAVCSPIFIAWSSFIAMTATSLLATARFMMPNVLVEPPTKFKIGPPTDYASGTVSTKWQAQFAIWVVNAEIDGSQMIYVLSTVCTHLGCTPNWLEGEQKFKCPCHGSGFYKTGVNFEGPAPRPLERMGVRLAEDGMLEVDKSVKFQQELGQWSNAASFVPIA
jgi:cytochrome b6-f complex iron-sulfur subunit